MYSGGTELLPCHPQLDIFTCFYKQELLPKRTRHRTNYWQLSEQFMFEICRSTLKIAS